MICLFGLHDDQLSLRCLLKKTLNGSLKNKLKSSYKAQMREQDEILAKLLGFVNTIDTNHDEVSPFTEILFIYFS